jgi:hypothetical protein
MPILMGSGHRCQELPIFLLGGYVSGSSAIALRSLEPIFHQYLNGNAHYRLILEEPENSVLLM